MKEIRIVIKMYQPIHHIMYYTVVFSFISRVPITSTLYFHNH